MVLTIMLIKAEGDSISMNYYLGLDGGGTKTEVQIIDDKCKVIFSKIYSTCHIQQTGKAGFKLIMSKINSDIEVYVNQISYYCFGIPGYNEITENDIFINEVLINLFGNNINVVNDVEVALYGSLFLEDGIHVVSGTGSIAMSINKKVCKVSGGWGYLLGDEGSSYSIGLQGLKKCIKGLEDYRKESIILDLFEREYGFISKKTVLSYVYGEADFRSTIASFAPLVHKASEYGCSIAHEVLMVEARSLVELCDNLLERNHEGDDSVNVSYSGGTFNAKGIFRYEFERGLRKSSFKYCLNEPILNPIEGALLYSYCKINGENSKNEFLELKKA